MSIWVIRTEIKVLPVLYLMENFILLIALSLAIARTECSKWPFASHRCLGQFWGRAQSEHCPAQLEGEGSEGGWLFVVFPACS